MPAWETLKKHQLQLIRKALEGSTFLAPPSAAAVTALTGPDMSLLALPSEYVDVGAMSDDGSQFAENIDSSDITSWGHAEPTRRDITSDVTTLQMNCQETSRLTMALYNTVDPDSLVPGANGEVTFDKPSRPRQQTWRSLTIGVDLADGGEIYIGRFLPRASVTDKDDQNFQSSDDEALGYPVTMTAYMDSTLGTSCRFFFGGPGWAALLTEMGFEATPTP